MKQDNRKPPKFHIPPNRIPIYTAAIAGLAMLLALMIVFLPHLKTLQDAKTTHKGLRNPTLTQPIDDKQPSEGISLLSPDENTDYTLSVSAQDNAHAESLYAVPRDAALSITTAYGITADALSSVLKVTQADTDSVIPVTVTDGEGGAFSILPTDGAWRADTLYRINVVGNDTTIPDFSAAFQTARPFSVETVYPADEMIDVPVDTGIEITFSQPVTKADLASYITVIPSIAGRFELYPDGKTAVIIPDKELEPGKQYALKITAGLPSDSGQTLTADTAYHFCTKTLEKIGEASVDVSLNINDELLASPGKNGIIDYNIFYYSTVNGIYPEKTELRAKVYAFASADAATAAIRDGYDARKLAPFDSSTQFSTDGLTLVYEGTLEKTRNEDFCSKNRERGWLYIPAMDAGTYVLELTAIGTYTHGYSYEITEQYFYQVTALRAYTEGYGNDLLLWVNRTDASDPAKTAAANTAITAMLFHDDLWMTEEELSGNTDSAFRSVTAVTDDEGVATLTTDDCNAALLLLRHNDQTLILCTSAGYENTNDFRTFVYTDRVVYFPNDTVRIFGFLGRAHEDQTLPQILLLRFADSETDIPITVSSDGSFESSFPIENWSGTYLSYRLSIPKDETNEAFFIYYGNVSVTHEEKPVYQMDISFDQLFYDYNDTHASVTLTASYFDGTPAAGLSFRLRSYDLGNGNEVTVVTDETGVATYRAAINPDRIPNTTINAVTLRITAELTGYETTTLTKSAYTYYFHSSGVFEANRTDDAYSEITLHALDTSRLLSESDFSYANGYNDNTKGEPLSQTVSVILEKIEYIKTKTGTTYDPISKTFRETYSYTDRRTVEKTFTKTTENGTMLLDHLDASAFRGYYQYHVTWQDSFTGRSYTHTLYANHGVDHQYTGFGFYDSYVLIPRTRAAFPGDRVTVDVISEDDDTPVTLNGTSVLFTHYAGYDGRIAVSHVTSGSVASYKFVYSENGTLGTTVAATVFDGSAYQTINPTYIAYDYTRANQVDLTVSSDRATYTPGEDAVVSVDAPELAGGVVLVSIVDEACFALGEQSIDPIADYFSSVGTWGDEYFIEANGETTLFYAYHHSLSRDHRINPLRLLSRELYGINKDVLTDAVETEVADEMPEAPGTNGSAEVPATGGDSGDGKVTPADVYVRKNFADNPVFTRVYLDENGHGKVALRVPDNVTTWRLTAIGVTGVGDETDPKTFSSAVRIGMDVSDAVCSLPFFINVNLPDLFLQEDQIAFSVHCAGTKRADDPMATVMYHAVLFDETETVVSTHDVTAAAADTAWFILDPMKTTGAYTVEVTGTLTDGSTDAVRSEFRVTETAQVIDYTETVQPTEISTLSPVAFPVQLSFYDNTDSTYFAVLNRLLYSYGHRTESLSARYAALEIAEVCGRTPAWYTLSSDRNELSATVNGYWGFLPLNEYAEGDPVLTAEVLYATPTLLSAQKKAQLIPLFESVLSSDESDAKQITASLLALASMGEPVLDRLYNAASYANNADTDVKLYLAAAFAAAGDLSSADAVLRNVTTDLARELPDGSVCITNAKTEEAIRLTALALLSASEVQPELAPKMAQYLLQHTSTVDIYVPELAAFLTHYTPNAKNECTFSYKIGNGDTVTVTLKNGKGHNLSLTKTDFDAFSVVSADDGIVADATYGALPETVLGENAQDKKTLKIRKDIVPYDEANGIYQVTLQFEGTTDLDSMAFSITETIPSGARFLRSLHRYSDGVCLYNNGGQQLKGTMYVYNPEKYENKLIGATEYIFHKTYSYLIRGAVKGSFTFEPTLAVSREAGLYADSEIFWITIQDGAWTLE